MQPKPILIGFASAVLILVVAAASFLADFPRATRLNPDLELASPTRA